MAAIASLLCREPVTLTGAQAVNKSYPNFFEDFARLDLGGKLIVGGGSDSCQNAELDRKEGETVGFNLRYQR